MSNCTKRVNYSDDGPSTETLEQMELNATALNKISSNEQAKLQIINAATPEEMKQLGASINDITEFYKIYLEVFKEVNEFANDSHANPDAVYSTEYLAMIQAKLAYVKKMQSVLCKEMIEISSSIISRESRAHIDSSI